MTATDIATLRIENLGARGDGLAPWRGATVYVDGALPGELIEAHVTGRRGDGYAATTDKVIEPSPERRPTPCPQAATCGGCAVQHTSDNLYRRWKQGLLTEALGRRGLDDAVVEDLAVAPPASRRRARLGTKHKAKQSILGFRARHSHRVVPIDGCLVLTPRLMQAMERLKPSLLDLGVQELELTESDTGVDVVMHGGALPGLGGLQRITEAAHDGDLARVVWRQRNSVTPILSRRDPCLTFGKTTVDLPPGAFVQPTLWGEERLADHVAACVAGADHVADLYAGLGTFGLRLAERHRVTAVEGVTAMADAMVQAANRSGLAGRITAERRDLARAPLSAAELDRFDAVVFDPPRQGAREQSQQLAASRVPCVVAVSCHPGSFSRDARILVDGGYRLDTIWPVDQFLWSHHLELVGVFRRG
ncbi:MAG: hypothetical protein AAF563_16205 [Pseudomonadota bacterium]